MGVVLALAPAVTARLTMLVPKGDVDMHAGWYAATGWGKHAFDRHQQTVHRTDIQWAGPFSNSIEAMEAAKIEDGAAAAKP